MRRRDPVPDWVLWFVVSICALTLFVWFSFVLLGVTDAR